VVADGLARVNFNQLDGDVLDGPILAEVHAMFPSMQSGKVDQQLFDELGFSVVRCARNEQGEPPFDGHVFVEVCESRGNAAADRLASRHVRFQGTFLGPENGGGGGFRWVWWNH
jgi:hypothetical protein